MARKTFEDNHHITFTSDPNTPRMPSLIPEMTCDDASEQFGILEAGGRVPLGNLLRLMKHLVSDEAPHPASCPFHGAGSLDQARRHFDDWMEGGA